LFPGRPGAAIIPLGPELLPASSNLPGGIGRASLKRPPIWFCSERGLPSRSRRRDRWWALAPPFHPYLRGQCLAGGLFSVALSRDRSLWALPSVPPCAARTFLPGRKRPRRWPVRLPNRIHNAATRPGQKQPAAGRQGRPGLGLLGRLGRGRFSGFLGRHMVAPVDQALAVGAA